MNVVPRRQLYLTALSILFVVLMLLIFISISTFRNLNRERDTAKETVHRQALTLINALEAGARTGMMMQMAGRDAIGNLVHEIGRSDDIKYLYLVDADNMVVHHSIPSLIGIRSAWRPDFDHSEDIRGHVRRLDGGTRVYEVAKPFTPMGLQAEIATGTDEPGRVQAHFHSRTTVYLGMTMDAYESARQSDLQHAMIMGGIVLVLGGGVIYFFIVIRSYYMLSRTLQEAQDYTRQVIASMAHGVLSIDKEGTIVSYNRQALSLLDIPVAGINQLNLGEIFDFDATGISQTLHSGTSVLNHEIRFDRRSSGPIPLMLTATPIHNDASKRRGAVVVIRDMSVIKELEKQVQRTERLAAVGRLAAGVAHEIRNPLSSIRGFAYLLGKGHNEESSEREYADVMVREIDRINLVVSDLLNFARPMKMEPEEIHLFDIIDHVVSLVSADAKSQDIDVHIVNDPDCHPISVDPNQVTQAILNLMLNAIQALDGGGAIKVWTDSPHEGVEVAIHVEDNGPGIAPDLQKKIFEPFVTTRERGTGLGLAMVRKIAESHNGGVHLVSPPPGRANGTRVTLTLKDVEI